MRERKLNPFRTFKSSVVLFLLSFLTPFFQIQNALAGYRKTPSGIYLAPATATAPLCHPWLMHKDAPLDALELLLKKLKELPHQESHPSLSVLKATITQLEEVVMVLKGHTLNYSDSRSQDSSRKVPASEEIQKLLQAHDQGLIDRVTMERVAYFLLPFIDPIHRSEVAEFFMELSTPESRDLLEVALHAMLHVDFNDIPARQFVEHLLFEMAAKHGFTDTILVYFDSDRITGLTAKLRIASESVPYPIYTAHSRVLRRALRYGLIEVGKLKNPISAVMQAADEDRFSQSLSGSPDEAGDYPALALAEYSPLDEENLLRALLSKLGDPRTFLEPSGILFPSGIILPGEGDADPQQLLTRALQTLIKPLKL